MKFKILSVFFLCFAVTAMQAQVDRSKMPQPGPSPEISLGSPASFELNNGLKVMVVENHKFPRVRMSLVMDNDPSSSGDKVGVKALYSAMMGSGTTNLDKEEFNQKVDHMGARLNFGSESASASSLSRFFPEVFELMADGLLNPLFTEEEFESQKDRMIEEIKSQQKSAEAVASEVTQALVFGKSHPYGEFETISSVEGLKLGDVKSYYNNYISPKHAYLVVVGDVKFSEVKKLAKKYLKSWKADTPPVEELAEVKNVPGTEIDFVDMPNAVQSEVSVTNSVVLKKSDPDYFPAILANQILGGGGEGRLFNNLREDKAYTYGAYSNISDDKFVSRFYATASVRNAVTDSAVVEFLNEIKTIRNEKVLEQELRLAKAKYTGSFVRALESPATIANYALNIETENLPEDFYQTFLQKINEVTVDDVQRVAKKYFSLDNARIVIVGKGKDVAEKLENFKYDGKSIPVKYFDKEANPVEKPVFNKKVSADVTVQSIYDDYIKAIGGKKAVEAISSQAAKYTGSMGPQSLTLETKQTKDGKSSMTVSTQGMVIQRVVFDGEKGFVEAQGQKQDLPEDQIESYREQGLFSELNTPEDAQVTGIETVDGEEAYVVKLSDDKSEYYSVDSGLKIQTVETSPQGEATTTYGDYKEVKGVKVPYAVSIPVGPQSLDMKADEIKMNEGVSDSDFE